ncbi:hypothetical protein Poly41_22030 [Novipirellula artificiosorum]|uniref:Uncharacterized protein n=1 Tax=Novipirellula artificiosorum TaxID=2528016 RepID=A0A5C6DX38_9BACT|nr:hypothetical protein Poly41_22030 [Novipirellula artificiosorum]
MLIPPGVFSMASLEDNEGQKDGEIQNPVRITKPFYLSVYEATRSARSRPQHANVRSMQLAFERLPFINGEST